jgi:hypothetical protein
LPVLIRQVGSRTTAFARVGSRTTARLTMRPVSVRRAVVPQSAP